MIMKNFFGLMPISIKEWLFLLVPCFNLFTPSHKAMDNAGGYEASFVLPVQDDHKCPVCHLVLRDPLQTDCGHRICSSCFKGLASRLVYAPNSLGRTIQYFDINWGINFGDFCSRPKNEIWQWFWIQAILKFQHQSQMYYNNDK